MDKRRLKEFQIQLNHRSMLVISGIIGAVWFLTWYGYECLDFTNVNWIYNSYNDIIPHYVGWVHFRNSDWHFPLGVFWGLTGQYGDSIVYADDIPILAIFFKIFRSVLPETFQYFGLFSLVSVVAQAVCGCELVFRLTGKKYESLISSLFFVSATVLGQRLFEHTSLTCHALILLALILFFNENDEKKSGEYVKWNILILLAVMIHAYYVPMIFALELFYYIRTMKLKEWYKVIINIAISSALALTLMYILGYFYGASYSVDNESLGGFGASVNAFISGNGYSLIDVVCGNGSSIWELEEGYAYLGAGAILLGGIALFYYALNWKMKEQKKLDFFVVVSIVLFAIVSMIPVIRWNWDIVVMIPLPRFLARLLGVFRSNGRFIWPVFYMIICLACVIVSNKSKYSKQILVLCLIVQVMDLLPYYLLQSQLLSARVDLPYSSEMMEYIPEYYDYIMLMDEPNSEEGFDYVKTFSIGNFSAGRQVGLSDFYIARKDERCLADIREEVYTDIYNGVINEKFIYCFNHIPFDCMIANDDLYYYYLDGIVCACDKPIAGIEYLDIHNGIDILSIEDYADIDAFSFEGNIVEAGDGGCLLKPAHILYKDVRLPKGEYIINLLGDELSDVDMSISLAQGSVEYLQRDDDAIICKIETYDMEDVSLQCINMSDKEIYVAALKIYY